MRIMIWLAIALSIFIVVKLLVPSDLHNLVGPALLAIVLIKYFRVMPRGARILSFYLIFLISVMLLLAYCHF